MDWPWNRKQDRSKPPTEGNLRQLPRWAKVAFAARCARRVQPLFATFWWKAPREHIAALDNAIALAESFSCTSRIDDYDYDVASANAFNAARAAHAADANAEVASAHGDLTVGVEPSYAASIASNANSARAAAAAALAATRAADAICEAISNADFTTDGPIAAEAARAAALAADRTVDARQAVTDAMWRDFDALTEAAARLRWTNDSPIPSDVFGPLWPDAEPEWWPNSVMIAASASAPAPAPPPQRDPDQLELRLTLPADATDDEIAQATADMILAASRAHQAAGGSGLKPDWMKVYKTAPVPQGVRP